MSATTPPAASIEVFVSYAHEDEKLRDKLREDLVLMQREGLIAAWHDLRIEPGKPQADEIDAHLESADIVLLLVSPGFVDSDYCGGAEVKRALERHDAGECRVMPVILSPCDWQAAPFGKLEALPKGGKAVADWRNRDKAFLDVAQGIRRAIADLSRIWNVPHARNPFFTGREGGLAALEDGGQTASASTPSARTQALVGLDGVGKTQIAIEYTYRYLADFDIVWWIRAEDAVSLTEDLVDLGRRINPTLAGETNVPFLAGAALRRLERSSRWLLIYDNAPNPDAVRPYLPRGGAGQVLITSRSSAWRGTAEVVEAGVWPRDESIAFLLARSGRSETERAAADELAEELDDLPLALEQAGAYIERTGKSLVDYLALFRTRRRELLARGEPPSDQYPDTVLTTWDLSFARVREESPNGADLLNLCAFFAPDDIPRALVEESLSNPVALDEAVGALQGYSLLHSDGDAWAVHRLVGAVVRDRLEEAERAGWVDRAFRVVDAAFTYQEDEPRTWPMSARLLPHVQAVIRHVGAENAVPGVTGRLLARVGICLRDRAHYAEAKDLFERALRLDETTFGPDHPRVATDLNNLGGVLHKLGDLPAARECYERAVRIVEGVYGPDHPRVAVSINSLGDVLRDSGDLPAAAEHYARALQIDEAAFGSDHPHVAVVVSNLGGLFERRGVLSSARESFEWAVRIDEAMLGPSHPRVVEDLNNLGGVHRKLGDFPAARECVERAVRIAEEVHGPDHPHVAASISNLGDVHQALGDLSAARDCFERALRIDEGVYGPDHPNVAIHANSLGLVLQGLGDLSAAREHFERALRIDEAAFGPDHPGVAALVNNLGSVFRALGDPSAARECYERALHITEKIYGPDHPNVTTAINNLGHVFQDLEDLPAAREHYERALRIWEQGLGPEHPQVAIGVSNLGGVLQKLGDLRAAQGCYERALRIMEGVYGPDHPELTTPINSLGLVLLDLGDLSAARACFERILRIDEAAYGPDHLHAAIDINNLGLVLEKMGELRAARDYYERAQPIWEQALGLKHPHVAITASSLGEVLRKLGDLPAARDCYERALTTWELVFGPEHPQTAIGVSSLGDVLRDMGDLPAARGCYERALRIEEAAYGPDHPSVAEDVNNMGLVLRDLGDPSGARKYFERALRIWEQTFGPDHPKTRSVQKALKALPRR